MQPVPWGETGLSATFEILRIEIQHVLAVLVWVLVAGLAAAAGCWCCGYAVRSAWLKTGPPVRRPRQLRAEALPPPEVAPAGGTEPAVAAADPIAWEAARGIGEIEAFLARQCTGGPRPSGPSVPPPGPDGRDLSPEA